MIMLGLDVDEDQIKEAIEVQSFKNKKQAFLDNGQVSLANFMRDRNKDQWREALSKKQKLIFSERLKNKLKELGYATY